jgi:hypothetical protein
MTDVPEARNRTAKGTTTIVTRQQLGRDVWDAAADASPEAWLWHRYDLCDTAVRDWPGRSDASFAVLNDHGRIEALLPAHILEGKAPFGFSVRYLNSNGGPALAPAVGRPRRQQLLEAIAAQLEAQAVSSRVVRTTIALPPMSPALRGPDGPRCNPLLSMGYEDISGQTWVADLRDGAEAAWRRLEGRARTSVRRAEEAGVRVRRSTLTDEWRPFFELHLATYQRLGVPSYPPALFRAIFEQLVAPGFCCVHFAELNGTPIAATNIACYKHGGYYWHGFASDQGLRTNALTLLIWNAIRDLAGAGILQWLDCGEAVLHPGGRYRQLSEFKKSFGGELYPAFRSQIKSPIKLYNRLIHLKGLIKGD